MTQRYHARVREFKTAEPFRSLFQRSPTMVETIAADMRANGFDLAYPIVTWNGVVVDGNTRLAAAKAAGLDDIPGVDHHFPDETAALEYAIRSQVHRRNLTEKELFRCQGELDKLKDMGRPPAKEVAQGCATSDPGKSAVTTAATLGVSPRKVEQMRTVRARATPEVRAAVESGDMTINAAYNATVKPAAEPPPAAELHEYDVMLTITRRVQATDAEEARTRAIGELRQLSVREMTEHITATEVTP